MLIVERYLIIQTFHLLKSIASVETFLWLYFISTHKNVTFIYSFKTFCIDYITPCMFQKFESTKSAFCPLPSPLPSPPQEEAHFWAWTVPTWAKALLRVALVIVLIVDNTVHLVSFKHAPWHSFHGGIQSTASCTPMAAALGTEGHPVICLSSLSWQMFRLFLTFCYSIYSEDLRTYILLHVWVKCRVNGFVTDQWKDKYFYNVESQDNISQHRGVPSDLPYNRARRRPCVPPPRTGLSVPFPEATKVTTFWWHENIGIQLHYFPDGYTHVFIPLTE